MGVEVATDPDAAPDRAGAEPRTWSIAELAKEFDVTRTFGRFAEPQDFLTAMAGSGAAEATRSTLVAA